MTHPKIDTQEIRDRVDLRALVERDEVELYSYPSSGATRYYYGACPFCGDGDDRFKVFPNTQHFNCRVCRRKGDAIAYVMASRNLDFVTAAKWLNGADDVPESNGHKLTGGKLATRPGLEGDQLATYRERLTELAGRAAQHMARSQSPEAYVAWEWLQNRGIQSEQILRFNVGYNDYWREIVPGYKLPPGVTLPRYDEQLQAVAVNVYLDHDARELTGCRRQYAKGSVAKSFLNAGNIAGAELVIVTEGELDCILLANFYPPLALVQPITTGGAQTIPDALDVLDGKRVVLAFDDDEAGRAGVAMWRERLPEATVASAVTVPEGKDVTDFWAARGPSAVAVWLDDVINEAVAT